MDSTTAGPGIALPAPAAPLSPTTRVEFDPPLQVTAGTRDPLDEPLTRRDLVEVFELLSMLGDDVPTHLVAEQLRLLFRGALTPATAAAEPEATAEETSDA